MADLAEEQDVVWPDFDDDGGRDEELDDVLEFVRQQSVDAYMRGEEQKSAAYDALHEKLQREEHRK